MGVAFKSLLYVKRFLYLVSAESLTPTRFKSHR